MSQSKYPKLPDLGARTDEIEIYAGPCSVESEEQFNAVAETIGEVFSHNDFIVEHKTDIAKAIAHHEFANIFEYEFGVEETIFFTLK
jgi:3-deoxy-D-manno-octulosonic acid (KDO) 8-phosphate synthase